MLKRFVAPAGIALAILAGAYFFAVYNNNAKLLSKDSTNTANNVTETEPSNPAEKEDNFSLALKTIELSQGEGGFEIWRLKAQWANMDKDNELITVEKPKLTYFMPEDNSELHVVSDSGDVDQRSQILRFVHNVLIQQKNSTARGELLIYNGTARTMTFPRGSVFTGDGIEGSAPLVIWRMEERIIEGRGGVDVFFARAPDRLGRKKKTDSE